MGFLRRLFGGGGHSGRTLAELAERLGETEQALASFAPSYRAVKIPKKRKGAFRTLQVPDDRTKHLQRRVLRRVLSEGRSHYAATGFERGSSIVTNAKAHAGFPVVVRMDIQDFFDNTQARRVEEWYRRRGWDKGATAFLVRLTTHERGLPQGAPTSPRLSNLVNAQMDRRLMALAGRFKGVYTRYADDLTFSLAEDDGGTVHTVCAVTRMIAYEYGYKIHLRRKLHVRRSNHRQLVTGLVVNDGTPRLPREVRRRLRAIEHRMATTGEASLTPAQLEGWRALRRMVEDRG
jgi:retron-type reverse transcriptase